jgi:hypothetical protein
MITIFIIAIGNPYYKKLSLEILKDYFTSYNFKIFILEDSGELNIKNAHPSWLKLISHKYTNDDNFTLCWDLDLLPRAKYTPFDVKKIDFEKINMCYDTSVLLNSPKFNNNFFFNGGLIGIPISERNFMENIYEKHAPGVYPSYEQYYLNDEIVDNKKEINTLPVKYNTLFHNGELFDQTDFSHYTWRCNDTSDRDKLIEEHYTKYFQ